MTYPQITIKDDKPRMVISPAQMLLNEFWDNGGKEKYEATKELRAANGIPDSQWFKANLMSIIDEAEITYNAEETK